MCAFSAQKQEEVLLNKDNYTIEWGFRIEKIIKLKENEFLFDNWGIYRVTWSV